MVSYSNTYPLGSYNHHHLNVPPLLTKCHVSMLLYSPLAVLLQEVKMTKPRTSGHLPRTIPIIPITLSAKWCLPGQAQRIFQVLCVAITPLVSISPNPPVDSFKRNYLDSYYLGLINLIQTSPSYVALTSVGQHSPYGEELSPGSFEIGWYSISPSHSQRGLMVFPFLETLGTA